MDEYKDDTDGNEGSNWVSASKGVAWTRPGGDYLENPAYSKTLPAGTEDLKVNITNLVES